MPNLEILELALIYLPKQWDDELPLHFYSQNLRILTVRCCHRLVTLFSFLAARELVKVQRLEISACSELWRRYLSHKKR